MVYKMLFGGTSGSFDYRYSSKYLVCCILECLCFSDYYDVSLLFCIA